MKTRLLPVDGLRALAVLAVVACHAAKYTMDYHRDALFHPLFEGAHGLDLFFVISGFCLSYPTIKHLSETGQFRLDIVGFFARRIVRIFPGYWMAFGLISAGAIALLRAGYQLPWPTVKLPTLAYGIQQLFLWDHGNELCGSFWTLALEFRWYLAFPLILWLWARSPIVFMITGALSWVTYWYSYLLPIDFGTLPAFMLGIVAANMTVRGHALNRWAPILFVGAVFISLRLEPGHLRYAYQDQIWWQVACFFLVLAGCTNGILMKLLSNRAIAFIGLASYSIYLMHDPIMAIYGYLGGKNVVFAATLGVLSGMAFWLLWERIFVQSPTRPRCVAVVGVALRWVLDGLRLPRGSQSLSLVAPTVQAPQP